MQLVIGNKNYSSWSLRPWLLLAGFDVEFDEQWVSLQQPKLTERLLAISGSARVPVLNDGAICVWDSLAICEYINETYLANAGLPSDAEDRAVSRAISAEMHAGFGELRNEMPMNIRASRSIDMSEQCVKDIARVDEIWSSYARADEAGQLRMFGQFGIADCMFAPVVMRFATYQPVLSEAASNYMQAMLSHPSLQRWVNDALQETEIVTDDEAGVDRD